MSIIDNYLSLNIPQAVNRCLLMGRELGISHKYQSQQIPSDIKKDLMKFLMDRYVSTQGYQARQCYFNAQMVFLNSLSSKLSGRIKYCEGLYASNKIPFGIPHAWAILDNQYLVDTTMVTDVLGSRKRDLSDRYIGQFPDGVEYEGICIEDDFAIERLQTTQESISFLDDYQSGFTYMKKLEKLLKK
jgi:hypothetical protein